MSVPAPPGIDGAGAGHVEADAVEAVGGPAASAPAGLTSSEAAALLSVHGRNELADETKPAWRLYAEQFVEPMPLVIWIAIIIEVRANASSQTLPWVP